MKSEPKTLYFANLAEAIADAKERSVSVWKSESVMTPETHKYCTGSYDGLQNDMGWYGSSSYVWQEKP